MGVGSTDTDMQGEARRAGLTREERGALGEASTCGHPPTRTCRVNRSSCISSIFLSSSRRLRSPSSSSIFNLQEEPDHEDTVHSPHIRSDSQGSSVGQGGGDRFSHRRGVRPTCLL